MGRYANGGCSYDKSYYLSLWSGPSHLNRDLKGQRTKIRGPRYQLTMCAHPWSIISTLLGKIIYIIIIIEAFDIKKIITIKAERQAFDDGFFHRIIFACPEPAIFDAKSIEECARPDVCLPQLLLFIKMIHTVHRSYKFDNEAHVIMRATFDKFQTFIRRANRFDFFVGYSFIHKLFNQSKY